MSDDPEELHPLILPDVPIVMPQGELPVVREGTIGGIPAYEPDEPRLKDIQMFNKMAAEDELMDVFEVADYAKAQP